jgi:hypothetical protein
MTLRLSSICGMTGLRVVLLFLHSRPYTSTSWPTASRWHSLLSTRLWSSASQMSNVRISPTCI